jgi:hypothetical protein
MAKNITILLFIAAVLLTACSSDFDLTELEETSDLPGAGDINAAAGRAAANDQSAGDEPAETPSSDSETAISKKTPDRPTTEPKPTDLPSTSEAPPSQAPPSQATNRRVEVGEIGRFPQLLPFDGIRPVYDPQFATVEEAPLDDNELIIGIALDGEAKAYPISVLNFREMVNDELAGIPTLVTW